MDTELTKIIKFVHTIPVLPTQLLEVRADIDDSKASKVFIGLEGHRKWRRLWSTSGMFDNNLKSSLKNILSSYEFRRKNN